MRESRIEGGVSGPEWARLRRLHDEARAALVVTSQPPAAPFPCVNRGAWAGDVVECLVCGDKRTSLKVFPCSVLGRCMPDRSQDDIVCCATCPFREVPTPAAPPADRE